MKPLFAPLNALFAKLVQPRVLMTHAQIAVEISQKGQFARKQNWQHTQPVAQGY